MKTYIKNILSQLKEHSKQLDDTAILQNKPWILIDEKNNRHHYSFLKDGSLIMALNGKVQKGRWEYIKGSKCLLIDREKDSLLLNHLFIDDGLLFLKLDGSDDKPIVLINEMIIPDLNYEQYLRKMLVQIKGLKLYKHNGNAYYVKNNFNGNIMLQDEFYDEDIQPLRDGTYEGDNVAMVVANGKLVERCFSTAVTTVDGHIIQIKHKVPDMLQKGDHVTINEDETYSGKVKIRPKILNGVTNITLDQGIVTDYNTDKTFVLFWLGMLALIIGLVVYAGRQRAEEAILNTQDPITVDSNTNYSTPKSDTIKAISTEAVSNKPDTINSDTAYYRETVDTDVRK